VLVEQGREFVGQGPVSELGGVQPVAGPELAVVDARVVGEDNLHAAIAGVDLVVDGVEVLDAPPHGPSQEAGEAEDAAVVVEAHGQQQRSLISQACGRGRDRRGARKVLLNRPGFSGGWVLPSEGSQRAAV